MKPSSHAAILFAALLAGGCQNIPIEEAALCSELARFANTTNDSVTHEIELTADWGGQFSADDDVIAEKTCSHHGYAPGNKLCDYLLEHTSTEFPDANVNSVMVCLGAATPAKMVYDLDYGRTVLWSHVTRGVKPGILVGIDYSPRTVTSPPSLKILARKDH